MVAGHTEQQAQRKRERESQQKSALVVMVLYIYIYICICIGMGSLNYCQCYPSYTRCRIIVKSTQKSYPNSLDSCITHSPVTNLTSASEG